MAIRQEKRQRSKNELSGESETEYANQWGKRDVRTEEDNDKHKSERYNNTGSSKKSNKNSKRPQHTPTKKKEEKEVQIHQMEPNNNNNETRNIPYKYV